MHINIPNSKLLLLPAVGVFVLCLIQSSLQGEDDGYPDEASFKEIKKQCKKWKIIPDAFFIPARHELLIRYEPRIDLKFGTLVRPAHDLTWLIYNMMWNAQENSIYTLMLIGLDEPSVQEPSQREYLFWLKTNIPLNTVIRGHTIAEYQHPRPMNNTGLDEPSAEAPSHREYLYWLQTNIPLCKISNGYTVAEYQQPKPQNNTGVHRYVFIAYRQPAGEMIFKEEGHIKEWDIEPRYNFSNRLFADKYGYAGPYAVNWFTAEYMPPHYDFLKGYSTSTTLHPHGKR